MKILLSLFFVLTVSCGTSRKLVNYTDNEIPEGINSEKFVKAVKTAAIKRKWAVVEEGKNKLIATLNVRKHMAKVEVNYTKNQYDLVYKDSRMLEFDSSDNSIHRNYNRWVRNFKKDIDLELARITVK